MPFHNPALSTDLSLYSSEVLEVVAESGNKRYFVHSKVLAVNSDPPGGTTGAPEEPTTKIDISDYDGDTVGRFIQFLYTGDYALEKSSEGTETQAGMRQAGLAVPDIVQDQGRVRAPKRNVLLAHAKLYSLARYKGVKALGVIAFERLDGALCGIDGSILKRTIGDIIEMLKYVYTCPESPTSMDYPLRNLTSVFIAKHLGGLMETEEMRSFLGDSCDFMPELMEKIVDKMNGGGTNEIKIWKDKAAALDKKVKELEAMVLELEVQVDRLGVSSLFD